MQYSWHYLASFSISKDLKDKKIRFIFTEQERLDAEEAFEEEMDAVAEAARVEFKELCAAELAATAAKKAAAAAPARPTTRAATKRGTEANNEPSQQPKRRR